MPRTSRLDARDDGVALAAYRALCDPDQVVEAGGATCLRVPEAPDSPMLNRVVGLGLGREASEADVEATLAAMGDLGFYVSLEPSAQPPQLPAWLEARGLEPAWGWMRFVRGPEPAPPVDTTLEVREVGPELTLAFARIQRIAYGLPEAIEPFLVRRLPSSGWQTWLAFAGDEPIAAAGLHAAGDTAYFGFGATLPEHRGRGGQSALFAARIERARELGCTHLTTETGERRADRPSDSYRNILRFGFRERDVLANWMRRRIQPRSYY